MKTTLSLLLVLMLSSAASAQENPPERVVDLPGNISQPIQNGKAVAKAPAASAIGVPQIPDLSKRENLSSAMQLIILLTVLSLAPAILIMMTSFTRIIIVLSLLRQALGTQSLPPNQVLVGLSLFMTFLIMSPTWQRVNSEAIAPYMDNKISQQDALARAQVP